MHLKTFVDDVAVRSSGKSSNFAISAVLELLRLIHQAEKCHVFFCMGNDPLFYSSSQDKNCLNLSRQVSFKQNKIGML